ncbi:MAG TPA: 50S ribosomal protein L11 methyltransferase [Gaiellaceae bacterium]|nr:50S ribosomal protein L11 methyltransferase [Gaiellaceae bacterium]
MLMLFPEGFEEVERAGATELVVYTDSAGEERVWHVFGAARSTEVEEGWEDRWQSFHHPVEVGRLWVGPSWEKPRPGALAVVIDPGRAFGTGAHPTTRLCLRLLQEIAPAPLLDVGCGSGVLGIAAALLGFEPVVAVDVEPPAVEAARANAEANGVRIDARLVDLTDDLPATEIAVANISLAGVTSVAERVEARTLLTSGYLISDGPEPDGWAHVNRVALDGWAADVFERA